MVFHQSFVTNEPVNIHCLCRTSLLKLLHEPWLWQSYKISTF